MSNSNKEYQEAREYWRALSDKEMHEFHQHYTAGAGRGTFAGVGPGTSYCEYVIRSAQQSAWEAANDV